MSGWRCIDGVRGEGVKMAVGHGFVGMWVSEWIDLDWIDLHIYVFQLHGYHEIGYHYGYHFISRQ